MNKIFILLISIFLLSGCASGVALIGPATGAANGKIAQSTLKSAVSYGIKKQTGKSPLEHALAYAGEKNPNNKNSATEKMVNEPKDEIILEKPSYANNFNLLKESPRKLAMLFQKEMKNLKELSKEYLVSR